MNSLTSFLYWVDALPARYWFGVWSTLSLVVLSAIIAWVIPLTTRRWNHPLAFTALLFVALLAFRWPLIFDNRQFVNPDESQIIAGAIVLQSSPVFWQSVDGTTHGPLVQWPLAALGAAGIRLDFTNARLFAAALVWLALVFTWRTLAQRFGDGLSRILILPAAVLIITVQYWDFTQYSTEQVPIFLLATAIWLLFRCIAPPQPARLWQLAGTGFLLGAVPFAKLQAAPIGLFIGGAGILLILTERTLSSVDLRKMLLAFMGSALAFPVFIFLLLTFYNLWPEFWISYFEQNIHYKNQIPIDWSQSVPRFRTMASITEQFSEYFYPLGSTALGAFALRLLLRDRSHLRFTLFSIGLLGVSFYAVLAPNRQFLHYLQFSFLPLTLVAACAVGPLIQSTRSFRPRFFAFRPSPVAWALAFLFLTVGTHQLLGFLVGLPMPREGRFIERKGKLSRGPIAGFARYVTHPGESIAMWGWEPHHLVEADRPHATREAHSALEIFESPYRDYFRGRYLDDLQRSNPPLFVDVVGPGSFYFTDRERYAHETFPALADHISARYRLVAEIANARVYLRNDRPFNPPAD